MDEKKKFGTTAVPPREREQWTRRRQRLKHLVDSGDYELQSDIIAEHMVDRLVKLFASGDGELALV